MTTPDTSQYFSSPEMVQMSKPRVFFMSLGEVGMGVSILSMCLHNENTNSNKKKSISVVGFSFFHTFACR